MNVEFLPDGAPAWHRFLEERDHDFYHLPAYVALCAGREGAEACALLIEDRGERLLLPLLLRPVVPGLRDAASPYGYPGPLTTCADPAFVDEAWRAAIEALARARIVSLFVRSHPLMGPPPPTTHVTVVEHGLTVSVDLSRSPEELWLQTARGHRNEINKAIRAGHRALFDESFKHFGEFARIYRATMERREASAYYLFSDDYFRELRDVLGDRLRLCVVDIGGEIAAAGLFVVTRGIVQYHLSGTDARFERERPTKLMLHFVRSWAREQGLGRLHLGGGVGSQDDSLFKFKAGFATDRHPFRTLRAVCDVAVYERLVRATHPTANPDDRTGFFPLYRRPA